MKGLVFDMQHYSLHDGPGIRTLVFLKGCPLKCLWCANPESQSLNNEIMMIKEECIGLLKCGRCRENCPNEAISSDEDGQVEIDRRKCTGCGICAENCPGEGINNTNTEKTVAEVLDYVMKDLAFYRKSGGGVTLSGGEPLMQYAFAMELVKAFKKNKIHVAIETTAFTTWDRLSAIAEYVDLFLIDIKHMDSEVHKKYTGKGNENILENIKKLYDMGKKIEIRIPLIPDINDTIEALSETANFLAEKLPGVKISMLPYHRLGQIKYLQMGRNYQMEGVKVINTKADKGYMEDRERLFQK